ncbi:MAG: TetR/AcrR family transcriptional regulator [Betaproteobacteria bacterium]|nr:TetR/AcrR family transcriptional regulator [Betaproteobacteria bacterium]
MDSILASRPQSVRSLRSARAPRADNRLSAVLEAAARLFAQRGYAATSMRDIAQAASMLPGSLYYHFAAKEDLLAAVYEAGVRDIVAAAQAAAERQTDPWDRLEAACVAHLETVLRRSDTAQVLIRVLPEQVPAAAARLKQLRAEYEDLYRALVAALPLAADVDRRTFRLMLLGALNWTRFWYRESGADTPRVIARRMLRMLRARSDTARSMEKRHG